MKRLTLPTVFLGLITVLTACPNNPDPPAVPHSLTVNVTGVPSAPVKVTNTSTGTVLFDGTIAGSKTFANITAGQVITAQPGTVANHITPPSQSVALDADKTITLDYKTPTPVTVDPGRLVGNLTGWPFASGDLYLSLLANQLSTNTPVKINSAGTVDFVFPTPPTLTTGILAICTPQAGFSGTDILFDFTLFGVLSSQGDYLGNVYEYASNGQEIIRVYAEKAGRLAGTAKCNASNQYIFDLNLNQGWNAVTASASTSSGINTVTVRNMPAGTTSTLEFVRSQPFVPVDFTDTATLVMRNGESANRAVTLYQDGAIDGTVTLETNVPGLTVTPASMTLPPLNTAALAAQSTQPGATYNSGRQTDLAPHRLPGFTNRTKQASTQLTPLSLSGQAVATTLTFTAAADAMPYTGPLRVIVKKAGTIVGAGELSSFMLLAPGFTLGVTNPTPINLYPAEPAALKFMISPSEGFSGPVTVTLENPPVGVTAGSVTGTPGSTEYSLPLNLSAALQPGQYTLTLLGTSGNRVYRKAVDVQVMPRRIPLATGIISSLSMAANGDLWGVQSTDVIQIRGEQIIARYPLPGGVWPQQVKIGPEGSIWARGGSFASLYRLNGTTFTELVVGDFNSQGGNVPFAVDAMGRAWVMFYSTQNGTSLRRIDPATGQNDVINTVKQADQTVPVANDATGENIIFMAADGSLVRVDTTSSQSVASAASVAFTGVGEKVRFLTLDRIGQLWAAVSGPRATLNRIDLSAMNVAQTINIGSIANAGGGYSTLVVENSSTGWFASSGNGGQGKLIKLDLNSGTTTETLLDNLAEDIHALSLAPGGGVAYTFGYQSGSPVPEYMRFQR